MGLQPWPALFSSRPRLKRLIYKGSGDSVAGLSRLRGLLWPALFSSRPRLKRLIYKGSGDSVAGWPAFWGYTAAKNPIILLTPVINSRARARI